MLLHASPVSSRVFAAAMQAWGQHFTCLAFDTPGNGLSEPLPGEDVGIAHYADAQVAALRALGVTSCIVYGRHTGASIAVEIASRHPALVTLALTDGYPVFTQAQREAYLRGYLADLPTSDDGSHVAWLWSRYRDQFIFWPWNKRTEAHRADCDMPEAGFLNDGVVALLEAGNDYKKPYTAVFRHDAMATLHAATVPVCIASRPGDSLYYQRSRFPAAVWTEEMPRKASLAVQRELELMLEHAPRNDFDHAALTSSRPAGMHRGFVDTGREYLHTVVSGGDDRPVLVVIGSAPGAIQLHTELLIVLAEQYRVFGIDPAGSGDSDAPADGDMSVQGQARRISFALETLGVTTCSLAGLGPSAAIALEIARQGILSVDALVLIDPLLVDASTRAQCADRYASNVSPRIDGTHMLALWHQLRDAMLWFPWFDQRRAAARPLPTADVAFDGLDERFLFALKHCRHYKPAWRAAWGYPLEQRLEGTDVPVRIVRSQSSLVPVADGVPSRDLGTHLRSAFERLVA